MSVGTHQDERALAVLESERFAVDAMQLDQLVALCARLSARLRFVDLNGHDAGTWAALFESDESLVLAGIASFDHYRCQQALIKVCDFSPLASVAEQVLALAALIDGWHRALSGSPLAGAVQVRDLLQQLAQGHLAPQLASMLAHFGSAPSVAARLGQQHAVLQPGLWAHVLPQAPPQVPPRQRLRMMASSFLGAIQRVQQAARASLRGTLDSGHHEPAAGLLLSFLRLYGSVQTEVNHFAERHVDFYYRDVLGLRQRRTLPDRVHVACLPDPRRHADLVVPAGTRFEAGKDADDQPLWFEALHALEVGTARVADLATLLQQREQAIAPESELGFVSGVMAARLGLPAADAEPTPVFGGGLRSRDATLGLAVASPLLALAQGERTVEVELTLAWQGPSLEALLAAVRQAAEDALNAAPAAAAATADKEPDPPDASAFRAALGPLVACWLVGGCRPLHAHESLQLLEFGRRLGAGGSVLKELHGFELTAEATRELAYFKYMGDLFELSLSTADGWWHAPRVQLARPDGLGKIGLRICIPLREDDPAICACDPAVHGAEWPTRLPLLRLRVSPRARLYPVSLFESVGLLQAELRVSACGVRDVLLFNQLGPLDASKSFAPFGPLPNTASYLALGAPEAAAKDLTALVVHLRWSGLPSAPGGFAAHYEGYGPAQAHGPFTAALSLLHEGQWRPCGGSSAQQPLFAEPDGEGRLVAKQRIVVDPVSVREFANGDAAPLLGHFGARHGLLRLQLQHPAGAFGHAAYPNLLSEAVGARTRRRRAVHIPAAPYTPELAEIRVDYKANSVLRLGTGAAVGDVERLLHLHPFGVAEVRPEPGTRRFHLLPHLGPDGSLAIGLDAPSLEGPLTLLFQLHAEDAAELPPGARRETVQWHYLAQDQWHALAAHRVLSDTTFGMLRTGIVTLDLPDGPSKDNSVMGKGLYWLRVGCFKRLDTAAPLISVHAHALALRRVLAADPAGAAVLPAGTISQTELRLPGLAGVLQVEASSGLQPAESATAMRTRAGERLRHKNRASLAWDYERLVLQAFDSVLKVKCFVAPEAGRTAGQVLVVVVPRLRTQAPGYLTAAPRLDTLTLSDIHQTLARRASPFVQLEVRNVAYERIQARCRVRIAPRAHSGAVRRAVNQAVTEALSPWQPDGLGPQLQWSLRCEAVEARLRELDGVAGVAGLSLLHRVRDDRGRYTLDDSARAGSSELRHAWPWSLALPFAEHLIELVPDFPNLDPRASDLTHLEVGRTFVISGAGAGPTREHARSES